MARFAPLDEMLAIPDPGDSSPIVQGFWHYARGEAFARAGNIEGVLREARAMPRTINPDPTGGAAPKLFKVSRLVLEGRAAMLENKPAAATSAFSKAAAIEESRPISESSDPPLWWYPVRRDVAAALLASGKAREALAAADASLKRRPRDAVALATRARAQDALGNKQAAIADRTDARRNWRGDPRALG
jgi:tetratricopeptide (TPR) repeat protein